LMKSDYSYVEPHRHIGPAYRQAGTIEEHIVYVKLCFYCFYPVSGTG